MEQAHVNEFRKKKAGNVRINVTLRGVRVTIVAVQKQYVLYFMSVYLWT
jgi:hypothetical protein